MMTQSWRTELRAWADRCTKGYATRDGILGVLMGGSLARGQEWRHSDMEVGVLVEARDSELPYFNVNEGRGVEVIQLVRPELTAQIEQVEGEGEGEGGGGDFTPIVHWPIQLWEGRVIHDPSGILTRFKQQFDTGLFTVEVVRGHIDGLCQNIDRTLSEARALAAEDKPAAALVKTRLAMNEAILVWHWVHGELPRSQSRTDSRLRLLCRKHADLPFYALYREAFGLADTADVVKHTWPGVKERVLEITRLWGDSARDFFVHAVDGDFQWRQSAGILTVYRLYIPIIGDSQHGLFEKLDDPAWASQNEDMLTFLGLAHVSKAAVSALIERVASRRAKLGKAPLRGMPHFHRQA